MNMCSLRLLFSVLVFGWWFGSGPLGPTSPASAEIPPAIYDDARPGNRPVWISARTFDARGIPDFSLLAPRVAERLRKSLAGGNRLDASMQSHDDLTSGPCDVSSRMIAEYEPRYDASDVFDTVISAHVGTITAVDTGFFGSNPATLIELTATRDYARGEGGLEHRDAEGQVMHFVHPAARLRIGGLLVCDFSAKELPEDIVGSAAVVLVDRPAFGGTGVFWTNERLLIIRPLEGPIFAPGVIEEIDLSGDLSAVVVELYDLWRRGL